MASPIALAQIQPPAEKVNFRYGSHLFLRDDELQLEAQINPLAADSSIRYLRFYCDRLTTTQNATATITVSPTVLVLQIFAREFLDNISELILRLGQRSDLLQIFLFLDQASNDLKVRSDRAPKGIALMHASTYCPGGQPHDHIEAFNTYSKSATAGSTVHDIAQNIAPTAPGRLLTFDQGNFRVQPLLTVPALVLEGLLPVDIFDSSQSSEDMMKLENLSPLLHRMFLIASQGVFNNDQDKKLPMSRLRFIIKCSKFSSRHAELASNAQRLLDAMEIPARYPLRAGDAPYYFVPTQSFPSLLKGTDDALEWVKRLEDQQQSLMTNNSGLQTIKDLFGKVIHEMGVNMEGFIDVSAIMQDAQDAILDCEAKRRDMAKYVDETNQASRAFNIGVIEFEEKKRAEFMSSIWKFVGELVVNVVIIAATYGTGATLTLGNLGDAVEAIGKGVAFADKLKNLIKMIAELAAKLIPKLMSAFDSRRYTQETMQKLGPDQITADGGKSAANGVLKNIAKQITDTSMPIDVTQPIDYLDILADWDSFENQVDEMFAEIRRKLGTEDINGMSAYRLALKSQAIRGRSVVAAMRTVQEKMQNYQRQEAERQGREKRSLALQKLGDEVATRPSKEQEIAIKVLSRSLSRDIASCRRGLFVRMYETMLGLVYYTNKPEAIRKIATMNPLSIAMTINDVKKVRDAMNGEYTASTKEARIQTLGQPVQISTTTTGWKNSVFNPDWLETLKKDNKIYFSIPWNEVQLTQRFSRLRIKRVTASFPGLKIVDPRIQFYQWDWEMGPDFIDKDTGGNPIQYYMPTQILRQTGGKGQWTDTDLSVGPSLFCRGRIVLRSIFRDGVTRTDVEVGDQVGAVGLDYTDVKEVILSFTCEGRSM